MNFKENRLFSFIFIFIVYLIATIIGIIVYNYLDYPFWLKLLIADIISTIIVFIFSCSSNNASVYDPYWSMQPIIIIPLLIIRNGFTITNILVTIIVLIWGVRLTYNWAFTFKNLLHQDWRYTLIKEKTNSFYPLINFIGIHLVPTLIVYSCILPISFLIINNASFNILSIIGLFISMIAIFFEAIADKQMHDFQAKNTHKLIRIGIWKYSRHPNYLGEILMWWGVAIYCILNLKSHAYLFIGSIANTLLFLFVSIPLAEMHQAARKEGYLEYKKETRMLLPFKK